MTEVQNMRKFSPDQVNGGSLNPHTTELLTTPGPIENATVPPSYTLAQQPQFQQYQQQQQQPQGFVARPQLIRIDSRSSLRPGFQNQVLRPPPPGGTQYIQRPFYPHQRLPNPNQAFVATNPPARLLHNGNPRQIINRPPIYQRPPGAPRPPGVYQQRSLPSPTPNYQPYPVYRSQTLDSVDGPMQNYQQSHYGEESDKPPLAALKAKAFSMSGGNIENRPPLVEDRRKSVSSVGSLDEEIKQQEKKVVPERPVSRNEMHMKKIEEDEDVAANLSSKVISAVSSSIQQDLKSDKPPKDNPVSKEELPVKIDKTIKVEDQSNKTEHKPKIEPKATSDVQQKPIPETKANKEVEKHPVDSKPVHTQESNQSKEIPIGKGRNTPDLPQKIDDKKETKVKTDVNGPKGHTEESNQLKEMPIGKGRSTPDLPQKKEEKKEIKVKIDVSSPKRERKISSNNRPEGDNDSGVDEFTQGNDHLSNDSPKKPTKNSTPRASVTPTKGRSFAKGGAKFPNLKSPESPTPGSAEKKKVPMNKVQVGTAASPNLKEVKSKIGSLQNATHKPGGGHVKIENRKIDFSTTHSRITAKNADYTPGGGEKKIQQQKLTWSAKSKIGSLDNTAHKPKGGEKKIESVKLEFKDKAKPKVGSKDNIKHVPGGGDVKIEHKKLEIKVQSKIGSMDNVKYKPGGGDKKIFDDKDYLRQRCASAHSNTSINGSQSSSQADVREPISDENLNQQH